MYSQIVNPAKPINWANPINKGLISRWQNMPYGVGGGGTTFRDLVVSSGNHGTLTNMALPSTSTSGWGSTTRKGGFGELRFAGTDDEVVMSAVVSGTKTNLTIMAWASRSATSNILSFGWGDNSNNRFDILIFTDGKVYFQVDTGAFTNFPNCAFSGIGYHHFALAFDGSLSAASRVLGYIDGFPKAMTAGGVGNPASWTVGGVFRIGKEIAPSNRFSVGSFDCVTVHDRTLTEQEIYQYYIDSQCLCDPTLNWITGRIYPMQTTASNRRRRFLISAA